jgi:hypothetical protein
MSVILDSIGRGGPTRAGATAAFFATRDRDSVLGRYSIDRFGDTTLTQYGVYGIAGSALVWDRAVDAAALRRRRVDRAVPHERAPGDAVDAVLRERRVAEPVDRVAAEDRVAVARGEERRGRARARRAAAPDAVEDHAHRS